MAVPMKLFLVVFKGKHKGVSIEVKHDLFLMGSDKACQLRSVLPGIAPQHCAVVAREGKVFVRDMGNGETETTVNKTVVPPGEEVPLHMNDRLAVGPLEFLVQFREKQLSQRDAEEWALKALDEAEKLTQAEELVRKAETERPATAVDAANAILARVTLRKGAVKGRLRIAVQDGLHIFTFQDVHLIEVSELASIKRELIGNIDRPNMRILLDFKNVIRCSSAAKDMILEVNQLVRQKGGSLALTGLNAEMIGALEGMGVIGPLRYFDSIPQAKHEKW